MITVTDLFCGAGGSSLGAEASGKVRLVMAANHWQTAIDVHQAHFPDAAHDVADSLVLVWCASGSRHRGRVA